MAESSMSYLSRIPDPADLIFNPTRVPSILVLVLLVLVPQLIAAPIAGASEIELGKNSVSQVAVIDPQLTTASSVDMPTKEALSTDVEDEVRCLALNIYFEARSEPESGQRAVGHVVMNRVSHSRYPDSVCKVVQQGGEEQLHRCQFSWWCDGRSDRPVNRKAWQKSIKLARKIYLGLLEDITGGALWYHATYVKPYWSDLLLKGDRIGQHVFYLENRREKEMM